MFTNVNVDSYVPTNKIKMVISVDNPTKTTKEIIKKAKESNKLLSNLYRRETKSIVILEDNLVIRSILSVDKILKRIKENGKPMLVVSPKLAVSVEHIKLISAYSKDLVAELSRNSGINGNELQFCRQRSPKTSIVYLSTGESICLSEDTLSLVMSCSSQDCLVGQVEKQK